MYLYREDFIDKLTFLKRSEHTIKGYDSDMFKFYKKYSEVNENSLQDYIFYLSNKNISAHSIQRFLSSVKIYCKFFGININFSVITKPRLAIRESSYIDDAVFEAGINNIKKEKRFNKPKQFIIDSFKVLYNTGLRIDEFMSLSIEDIVEKRNELVVIGKGNKERTVPINNEILDILKNKEFYTFINSLGSSTFLFWVKKYFGKEFSPHSFRHGYTTKLVNGGASEYTVKKVLGHASYTTTLRYFHAPREAVAQEVLKIIS